MDWVSELNQSGDQELPSWGSSRKKCLFFEMVENEVLDENSIEGCLKIVLRTN